MPKTDRPDVNGAHRQQYQANRKYILATQSVCAICGKPVDKTIKSPHPMSPTVDHIIPIARNGHPSDINNTVSGTAEQHHRRRPSGWKTVLEYRKRYSETYAGAES